MAYRVANLKLLPWWLAEERRRSYEQKFSNFERMCQRVGSVSESAMKRFDDRKRRGYR
jgi:hypothetical protein